MGEVRWRKGVGGVSEEVCGRCFRGVSEEVFRRRYFGGVSEVFQRRFVGKVCRRRFVGGGVSEEVYWRRCVGGGVLEAMCRRRCVGGDVSELFWCREALFVRSCFALGRCTETAAIAAVRKALELEVEVAFALRTPNLHESLGIYCHMLLLATSPADKRMLECTNKIH